MTAIEEARKSKFLDIAEKIYGRTTARYQPEFVMVILSKLDGSAYEIASHCDPQT
jgi:hypothetical protein